MSKALTDKTAHGKRATIALAKHLLDLGIANAQIPVSVAGVNYVVTVKLEYNSPRLKLRTPHSAFRT